MGATLLGQFFGFMALPFISRIYTPENFAFFQFFVEITGVIALIASGKLDFGILLPKSDSASRAILQAIIIIPTLGILSTLTIIFLVNANLSQFYTTNVTYRALSILIGCAVAVELFLTVCIKYHTRKENYNSLAMANVSRNMVKPMCQIALALEVIGMKSTGLVLGHILSNIVACIVLMNKENIGTTKIKKVTILSGVMKFKKMWKYPLVALPSGIFSRSRQSIILGCITQNFGLENAGYYAMAWKLLIVPLSAIEQAAVKVNTGNIATFVRKGESSYNYVVKSWKLTLLIGFTAALLLFLFGEKVIVEILGDTWEKTAEFCILMSPIIIGRFSSVPISYVFNAVNRQELQVIFDVFLTTSALLIFSDIIVNINIKQALLTYSIFAFIVYLITGIVSIKIIKYK